MQQPSSTATVQAPVALVTGGGGFLGRVLVRRLLDRGFRVRSLSRRRYPYLDTIGVRQIQGDLADARVVTEACRRVTVVFHTAAMPPPWGKYRDYYRTNVTGTRHVIAACRRQGVKRLVHTSSPSVIFDGGDLQGVDESVPYPPRYSAHYPRTKALAEQAVVKAAEEGLQAIVLRPHQIWGPEDPHFVPRLIARAKRLRQIGDGTNLVDTTYVDNAADAHLQAADALANRPELSGKIYFISQGEPVPIWDMINAVLKAAGLAPVGGRLSYRAAYAAGALAEWIYKLLQLPGEPPMTRFLADAVAKSHWFDIGAARRDLGYEPRIDMTEGMRRLTHWLRKRNIGGNIS